MNRQRLSRTNGARTNGATHEPDVTTKKAWVSEFVMLLRAFSGRAKQKAYS